MWIVVPLVAGSSRRSSSSRAADRRRRRRRERTCALCSPSGGGPMVDRRAARVLGLGGRARVHGRALHRVVRPVRRGDRASYSGPVRSSTCRGTCSSGVGSTSTTSSCSSSSRSRGGDRRGARGVPAVCVVQPRRLRAPCVPRRWPDARGQRARPRAGARAAAGRHGRPNGSPPVRVLRRRSRRRPRARGRRLHGARARVRRAVRRGRRAAPASRSRPGARTRLYPDAVGIADRQGTTFEARMRALEESLSPFAVRSFETRGRPVPEPESDVRTPFQRDRDRIVHSKPFRRLKGKTQVFIDPAGDHYRTRMTHTLETTAISRVVARALRLNEDLTEAIGLGHDTGHTPFGHAGEDALDQALNERFGRRFRHNEQSHRIAHSLNLTLEVCDGILTHTGEREPATLEGKIVRLVDRVAYINHDIDDAAPLRPTARGGSSARRDRGARADGLHAHRHARARHRRHVGRRRRHPAVAGGGGGDALAPGVHVRAGLPRPAGRAGAPRRRTRPSARSSTTSSPPATTSTRSSTTSPG